MGDALAENPDRGAAGSDSRHRSLPLGGRVISSWLGPRFRRPQPFTSSSLYVSQPDRLIGLGRLTTASFALLAVYVDPTKPITNVEETYVILAAYVAYALAMLLAGGRRPIGDPGHFITHAVDIVVLGLLALITEELDSPFFAFFTFALISATIRWGWYGVVTTALVLQTLLFIIGWLDLEDGDSELNILIIRSTYCWVAAAMLGYFASYRERSRRQLRKLATWPLESLSTEGSPWLNHTLLHAREVLGAAYIVVIWQEPGEGSARLAYASESGCQLLDDMDLGGRRGELIAQVPQNMGVEQDRYLLENLRSVFRTLPKAFQGGQAEWQRLYAAGFTGLRYSGRVFVINPPSQSEDMASLTGIVAARISSELERMALMNEAAASARLDARARLARDLHDSVLQDLTAAALQIRATARSAPVEIGESLEELRALLLSQQRRIREFVDEARPVGRSGPLPLAEHLTSFAARLSVQWGCGVDVSVVPKDLAVARCEAAEICLLLSEATANAVRHGRATSVNVRALGQDQCLELAIEDNGCGAEKAAAADIPYSLGERVAALQGALAVQSGAAGYALLIQLPRGPREKR